VKRYQEVLGHWLAEELRFREDTLFVIRDGRIVGCVAGGPGLSWESVLLSKFVESPDVPGGDQ